MASQAIRDILIRYGADDTDFKRGQKAVNKALYQNQSTAKALDKQFKATFDTSDITPLIRAQEHLTTALAGSQDKAQLLEHELSQIDQTADDFDPTAYARLEQELANARTQAAYLERDLGRVNQNINAIETGNLEDMTSDFIRAARNAGVLVNELEQVNQEISSMDALMDGVTGGDGLSGAIEGVSNFDTSLSGLLTTVLSLPGPLKIAGGAVLALGVSAVASARQVDRLNQIMIALQPTADATGVSLDQATAATEELYEMTGDLEGSIETVNGAMKLYGDSLNSTLGILVASISSYKIQTEGIMDLSEATKVAQSAQDDFNVSAFGTYAVLEESSALIAKYPDQVDDLGDSFKEFGDTMAGAGYDINEFFTFLNTGMVLGAKNTDELVNMVNELFIRITEGGDEVEAALNLIGTSTAKVQEQIAAGNTPQVLAEILFALNGVTDATMQATASTALFGTMGEEFVTPMLNNQSAALTQLETTYRLNQQATTQLAKLMGGALAPILEKVNAGMELTSQETEQLTNYMNESLSPAIEQVGLKMGLSAQEVANLTFKLAQGGFAALSMTEKFVALSAGAIVNGAAMGISSEQVQAMTDKFLILTDDTATLQEKLSVLNGSMLEFLFAGVLNEEQMAQLTTKFDEQITAIKEQITAYQEAGGALGIFTRSIWDNYGAVIEQKSGFNEAEFAAADFTTQVQLMMNAMGLSTREADNFTDSLRVLTSEEASSEERTEALIDVLSTLKENGYKPNIEALSKYVPLITEMNKGMDGSVISSNELTGEFAGMGKALDPTNDSLETFAGRLKDSRTFMDEAAEAGRDFADAIADIGEEADDAVDEVDDLNDALQRNSTMSAPQSGSSSSSKSFAVPQMNGLTVPVMPMSQNVTTNNSPTFEMTIVVNGSNLSPAELERAAKGAFEKFWFEKGRLN